ncbi:EXPA12 [Symbiodinium microadriaticum]|nr:EXPA12 [Symbiodinium microadriaticum]
MLAMAKYDLFSLRFLACWHALIACVQAKNATCSAQTSGSLMLQARQSTMKSQSQRAAADGFMTMWSDSTTTIVGGSCEYANAANGGLGSPAASSPYIASEGYCAVDSTLYSSGGACGSCWRVSYDGSPATDPGVPGSLVVQVVDSGSAKAFDCHLTAFQRITGASTGVFPITYEPVDCDVGSAGPVATVLDGDNAWYTKVIFSNLVSAVMKADLFLGESAFTMSRVSGATWSASTAGKRDAASFSVTLDTGDIIAFRCFDSWPVPTGSSCTGPPSISTSETTQSSTTTTSTTTEEPSTTTRTQASTTTTTTTSLPASKVWNPVDGGEGRACRGSWPGDNSPSYYTVTMAQTLEACQRACELRAECVGVEFSGSRCEIWTRSQGIQSSKALPNFWCLAYSLPTTGRFVPVDGGSDRACRGATPADNSAEYYRVVGSLRSLEQCQSRCRQTEGCQGVEYSRGRCEVWTRPQGIQASIVLSGFSCWRLVRELES